MRKRKPYRAEYTVMIGSDPPSFEAAAEHDGIRLEARFELRRGRFEPIRLTVMPVSDRLDRVVLSAAAIRRLPLGEMLAAMRSETEAASRRSRAEGVVRAEDGKTVDAPGWVENFGGRGAQRGQALTREDLEAVAAAYRDAWFRGLSVTEAVQNAVGGLSASGAAKRIMAARDAGLLKGVGPERRGTRGRR